MSSDDDKLIDFSAERDKRIHEQNDKRLAEGLRTGAAAGAGQEEPQREEAEETLISPLHGRLASTAATACRGPLGAPFQSSPDSTRFPAAIPGQRADFRLEIPLLS